MTLRHLKNRFVARLVFFLCGRRMRELWNTMAALKDINRLCQDVERLKA